MKHVSAFVVIILFAYNVQANWFVQYNFGLSRDFNSYTPENIQRSYLNEISFYFQLGQTKRLYWGASYNFTSNYQSESNSSSTTQSTQGAAIAARWYFNKNETLGMTIEYCPLIKLYYATENTEEDWSGSGLVIKPGLYPQLTARLKVSIEFIYHVAAYNNKEVLSGASTTSNFTRSYALPSAGIIWDF
ncbi:MAG: hypothetical protein JNL11_11940 [Bdellovibrionaceae bacterium]|nr:hypothetical protein [Pseudobdellovibrionaceae bacterium]